MNGEVASWTVAQGMTLAALTRFYSAIGCPDVVGDLDTFELPRASLSPADADASVRRFDEAMQRLVNAAKRRAAGS